MLWLMFMPGSCLESFEHPSMKFPKFLTFLLLLCTVASGWAEPSSGKYHAFRLSPGQDLKVELTHFLRKNHIKACAIVTCVGSLTEAQIRFANEAEGSLVSGPLEIVSLVGCGGNGSWHLHLSVADSKGKMCGGHLLDGCLIRTTAEIVVVELTDLEFQRVFDPESGFNELKVDRKRVE